MWDAALDLGWKAVAGLQMLSRAMSHHGVEGIILVTGVMLPLLKSSLYILKHILCMHWEELHLTSPCSLGLFNETLNECAAKLPYNG